MYGAIFGDIIGSRFEFDNGGKTKEFELFTKEDNWTDDSVMTIAIMEALVNAGNPCRTGDRDILMQDTEAALSTGFMQKIRSLTTVSETVRL